MFLVSVKKSAKEMEMLSDYERERLKNIAEIELQVCLSNCPLNMNYIYYLSKYMLTDVNKIGFPTVG
jgi:hypothetical protein